jgi:hypothetical protein
LENIKVAVALLATMAHVRGDPKKTDQECTCFLVGLWARVKFAGG